MFKFVKDVLGRVDYNCRKVSVYTKPVMTDLAASAHLQKTKIGMVVKPIFKK